MSQPKALATAPSSPIVGHNIVVMTLVLVIGIASIAACSPQLGGELGELQTMTGNCPAGKKFAGFVTLDASSTARSPEITSSQLAVARATAQQTAVCGGHLRVSAFSSSSAATETIYDGDLAPPGATETARLRQVPDLVTATMNTVEGKLRDAVARLPGDGTDVVAQLSEAREYGTQLGDGYELHAVIVTDGVATAGVITNTPDFTSVTATDLGQRVPVPDLTGAFVTFTGIGKVAGPPPPSSYVDALKTFYAAVCTRTKATNCTVVTDFTSKRSS